MLLPRLDNYFENMRRIQGDAAPCAVCGKAVTDSKAPLVHLVDGGHTLVVSENDPLLLEAQDNGSDLGCFPVGRDCLKNNPDLLAFAREVLTPQEDIYLGPSGPMDNYGSLE